MLKGFRDFILRGNVIDLAVAVVIGAAFSTVVTSIVENFITPLIGLFFNADQPLNWTVGFVGVGAIITAVLNFLITAAVVYFLVVVPVNRVLERMRGESDADAPPAPSREEVLLAEIRDAIRQNGGVRSVVGDGTSSTPAVIDASARARDLGR